MSKHERSQSSEDVLRHPSTKQAKVVDKHAPYEALVEALEQQIARDTKPHNVLHWFRQDLRLEDNRSLSAASEKAREGGGALITCFLFSPKDMDWHGESPARTDFLLETLRLLQQQLKELNIPLAFIKAEERMDKGDRMMEFIGQNDVSHVSANFEYEPDELRRDVELLERLGKEKSDVRFDIYHDQTIVEPATLVTGTGTPLKVFTPYHRSWLAEVGEDPSLFDMVSNPEANDKGVTSKLKDLFESKVPDVPESKAFESEEKRDRVRKLWPAGHKGGRARLDDFLTNKVGIYAETRSNPAKDSSSRMSPYFSSGAISLRETVTACRKANNNANFDGSGDAGIAAWVRELVFREFYRHMMVISPHDGMNLPHNLKFDFVEWEDDEEGYEKWCNGQLGVPFVDAGMRQLKEEAYMHNRLRMNTASYLRTNMLIDYRRGERFFAENLVDWDLCNNTQGWEPSYTVFNPVSQAERNDPDGDYIRRWVPELKGVKGKAVFDPYHRLGKEEFEKLGYPKPHLDFAETKERCIQRYKRDMADAEP